MFRTLLSVVAAMSIASVSLAQSAAAKTDPKAQMEARRVHRWLQEHPDMAERIIRSVQQRRDQAEDRDSPKREGRSVRSRSRSRDEDRNKAKPQPPSRDDRREQIRKRIEEWRKGMAKRAEEARKPKASAHDARRKTSARSADARRGYSSRSRSRGDDRSKAKPSSRDDRGAQIRKRIEEWRKGMAKRFEEDRKPKASAHDARRKTSARSAYSQRRGSRTSKGYDGSDRRRESMTRGRSRSGSYRSGRSSAEARRRQFRENIQKMWQNIGQRIKEARAKRAAAAEKKTRSPRTSRRPEKPEPRDQEFKRQTERRQEGFRHRRR